MNKKVTLLELVATKTVYAILIALYYWMWARRDWHDFYMTIQDVVTLFTVVFVLIQAYRIKKFKQEVVDELAEQNLTRANAICLKVICVLVIMIAFGGAMELMDHLMMGYALVGVLVAVSIIRTIIFYIMDVKGI